MIDNQAGRNPFDLNKPMDLEAAMEIYRRLEEYWPKTNLKHNKTTQNADRLRDVMGGFDGLLLDGFGVLNVGNAAIDGAAEMLEQAENLGISVIVVTNGASKSSVEIAKKYQGFGLNIAAEQVVSSRDAMIDYLQHEGAGIKRLGVIDSHVSLPEINGIEAVRLDPHSPKEWDAVDAIGFFGALNWDENWQAMLKKSMLAGAAGGKKIMVANPDVTAPYESGFTREPGFWIAKAAENTDGLKHILWLGKPFPYIFKVALKRLADLRQETELRLAMVGDSLHTDILGGQNAGLCSILIKNHGLFRGGAAAQAIHGTNINPTIITETI